MGKSAAEKWSVLKTNVLKAVKKHVPMRKVKAGGRPAWLTQPIMAAIRRKKRLWEETKKGGSMDEFRSEDKRVKKMIRTAKRNMEKRLAEGGEGNSRPFYTYVKKKTKAKPTIGPLKDSVARR